ncbi:hypothetical protein NLJ89_g8241 [Agrocybe chaxingu]|uniref:EF-hand domain-containing protein n=1 Tax=Agrocybe chaxingu TaxID=84603 RepID=A0A9W8K2T9_9AGAR|nr:hypothetical protein NLJ89_g8241 [Agrocybe chaxingu]
MSDKPRLPGILKEPHWHQGPLHPSAENLIPSGTASASSSSLHLDFYPINTSFVSDATMFDHEKETKEKDKERQRDDLVEVPLQGTDDPNGDTLRQKQTKVQFPDDVKTPPMPYPYIRTDSDFAFGSRASSIAATDDEDSEDYDWSDEEDLVDEEAKFEKHMGKKTKREGWGFKRIISLLFSSLIGSTFLAAILVAPGLLIHFYWYKPNPTSHRQFVKDNVQGWLFWAAANLLISWYLAMIIDIIPILIRFFISAFWGHVSESVKTKLETYDSVKDTAKPAFYAGSAYASWIIIFEGIYKLYNGEDTSQSRAGYTYRTAQVVQFFFFLVLVWTAYKDRVEVVEKALAVIEKLREYRPKLPTHTPHTRSGTRTPVFGLSLPAFSEKQHYSQLSGALRNMSPPVSRSGTSHGHEDVENYGDTEDANKTLVNPSTKKGKKKERLSWFGGGGHSGETSRKTTDPMEFPRGGTTPVNEKTQEGIELVPTSAVSYASGPAFTSNPVTPSNLNPHRYPPHGTNSPRPSLDSADATLKQAAKVIKNAVLHDARNLRGKNENLAGLSWNINSTHEAKRLARSIYMRLKDRGRTWLIPSDFLPVFQDQNLADEAFRVFDKDNNGDLSRAEIKTTLIKVYKERRFLSRSMRDVGEALKTLDRIMLFFAAVILFFISLSVFGVEVGDSLSSVYTIGIAASFIFKNAASNAFDAIMFFPYDTGDRVFIATENLVVKKVGLFATVFARSDGTETYYFNSQLFTKFITNAQRSGKTFENLWLQVAWTTPLMKLDALEKCLNDWLSTEENRWFEPSTNITLQHIVYQRHLELTIGIGHNGNWQDWGLRLARKTAFHAAVQYYCRQLGIVGYEAPLPIVYADPKTMTYQPESPGFEDILSPTEGVTSPVTEQRREQDARETEIEARNMKPTLGFLPPLADRSSHLTRARKSKNKKANLGAGNAG